MDVADDVSVCYDETFVKLKMGTILKTSCDGNKFFFFKTRFKKKWKLEGACIKSKRKEGLGEKGYTGECGSGSFGRHLLLFA